MKTMKTMQIYESSMDMKTKQYYMKVAQPGYENNVNTSLSNIIWK